MRKITTAVSAIALASLFIVGGCSKSSVTIAAESSPYRDIDIAQPDFIVIRDLGVTPADIRAKRDIGEISGNDRKQRDKEVAVGRMFSDALQVELVSALKKKGIKAYASEDAPRGTWKTGIVDGYYYKGSSLGFPLKGNQFDIRTVFNIQQVEIGDATLDVKTELSIDMLNAECQRVANREAKMVAKEIVDEIVVPAYKRRGWRP